MQTITTGAASIRWTSRWRGGGGGISGRLLVLPAGCGSAGGLPFVACCWSAGGSGEELVETAGEVALEGAQRAFAGLAVGLLAR
jgi:hypothetical protein